jgi:hypothetical protein
VRCASEFAQDPRCFVDWHESSRSAQTMAQKTPVLESNTHYRRRLVMLREETEQATVEIEPAPTWAPAHRPDARPNWRTVDRALRAIGKRRAALDADEARWLREAEALQIWRPLGMVSILDSSSARWAMRRAPPRSDFGSHVPSAPSPSSPRPSPAASSRSPPCAS